MTHLNGMLEIRFSVLTSGMLQAGGCNGTRHNAFSIHIYLKKTPERSSSINNDCSSAARIGVSYRHDLSSSVVTEREVIPVRQVQFRRGSSHVRHRTSGGGDLHQ